MVADCLTGDCTTELNTVMAPGLNLSWPSSRLQIESALKILLSSIGNDGVWTVPSGTLPKDFRATLWPTGLPNATRFPMLIVVEGANIWQAPNNPIYDLGTVPATIGTGTKFRNIYTDVDAQNASQVPYTPSGTYAGLWPPTAPTNVQDALDSIAQTFSSTLTLPKAAVRGSGTGTPLIVGTPNKATFLTTIDNDPLGMWSVANNQFTIPASQGGQYLCLFTGYVLTASVSQTPIIWIRRNSEGVSQHSVYSYGWVSLVGANGIRGTYAVVRTLAAGDTVSLWHMSSGSSAMSADNWLFSITKLN